MIADLIGAAFTALAEEAVADLSAVAVENDGPAARFIAYDPSSGVAYARIVAHGEAVRVNRGLRLLVEPLPHVNTRELCCVAREWSIQ